jgi:GST-like protein
VTYTLLANPGTGSAIAEAALELAGLPYAIEAVDPWTAGPGRERLRALNPLLQVPTLLLPDGSVMTESAAMVLHVLDRAPAAGLAPAANDAARPAFLRWLVFLVASLYPTFTFGDDPSRWVADAAARDELRRRTDDYRQTLWRQMEAALSPAPWCLGGTLSALDLYVGVMTHWRPRRLWFAEHCPKLHRVALALDGEARLQAVWARNFP